MSKPSRHAPRGPLKAKEGEDPIRKTDPIRGPGWRGCTAYSRTTGNACNGQPISGGTVCRMHGGAAKQVKEAAALRLARLVDPAIDRLAQLMEQKDFPSTAYQAVRDVLDRNMGKPTERLEATVNASEGLVAALMQGRKRAAEARKGQ